MKKVAQRLRDGKVEVMEAPPPELTPNGVLVDVRASLLSAGTERATVEAGRKSLIGKARARPDQVAQVIEKAKRAGARATLDAVRARLDRPSELGYSSAGVVHAVGDLVPDLAPGDRVACGGGGYAVHAEVNHVPGNLCVRLPEGVTFVEGAFATVGSIALHGVRQSEIRLGERVAVIGLGLVGHLAGKLLRAAGCVVVGIDVSDERVQRAEQGDAADVTYTREALAGDLPAATRDCDAVIITAATSSNDTVELAARLTRDRGRVVIVGAVGMNLPRPPFYDKELELRLSRSYGPGRYDRDYEERGLDYPIGYVRWTERRNMKGFVDLLARGRLKVADMVTDRFPIDEAGQAYERLIERGGSAPAIVIEYEPSELERPTPVAAPSKPARMAKANLRTGVIGTGSFALRVLLPAMAEANFPFVAMASATGGSARAAAERFGVDRVETPAAILDDPDIGVVVVATRHSSHAQLAARALRAGKHVFVEKPPCLTPEELRDLVEARKETAAHLGVGFNRRWAPSSRALREHVGISGTPFELLYRVNAGVLPPDHWINDPAEGGGRLLGEGCHFVDYVCWLAGAVPVSVSCVAQGEPGGPIATAQRFSISLRFGDGSVGSVLYGPGSSRRLGKEFAECHAGDRSAVLEDYGTLTLYDGGNRRQENIRPGGKGHAGQIVHFREVLLGQAEPEGPDPLETMAATLAALQSAEYGAAVSPGTVFR